MGFRYVYAHDPLPLSPILSFPLQIITYPATPRALPTATWLPFAVGLLHSRSLHSVTHRGRSSSWSAPLLGHPSQSTLLMVGPFTRSPFAVGPSHGRPLHSATLCGRPSSWSVPSLGHPSRSALLMVGPSTRSPFAVGPPHGRPLHSATLCGRPSSWSVPPLDHPSRSALLIVGQPSRSAFILPVSHNPHFLHYSLRWTKAVLGNGGLLTWPYVAIRTNDIKTHGKRRASHISRQRSSKLLPLHIAINEAPYNIYCDNTSPSGQNVFTMNKVPLWAWSLEHRFEKRGPVRLVSASSTTNSLFPKKKRRKKKKKKQQQHRYTKKNIKYKEKRAMIEMMTIVSGRWWWWFLFNFIV
ncbi:hypothetical protein CsSME_00030056 [Camellia sinensis var. sinensis]